MSREDHLLLCTVISATIIGVFTLVWKRNTDMASVKVLEQLRKAQEEVKKLAAVITEQGQHDQELANGLDEIFNTAHTALDDASQGGSTGGGSGAQVKSQLTAAQAAAAVTQK